MDTLSHLVAMHLLDRSCVIVGIFFKLLRSPTIGTFIMQSDTFITLPSQVRTMLNFPLCNDQTSKDLSLCAYRASPWIELASTHSIDEYQNSKCIIYYNV